MKPRLLHVVAECPAFSLGEQPLLLAPTWEPEFESHFFDLAATRLARPHSAADEGEVRLVRRRPQAFAPTIARLWAALRGGSYDAVHAWGRSASRAAAAALFWAGPRARRTRLWVSLEQGSPAAARWPIVPARRAQLQLTVGLPSQAASRAALPWAVPPAGRDPTFRPSLAANDSSLLLGTVCDLDARSGLRHLIWTIDLLSFAREDVQLVVWGEGALRNELQRFARQATVQRRIQWRSPRAAIRRNLGALSLYWHPQRTAAASHPLIAALASGLPAVATRSPELAGLQSQFPRLRLVPWGARDEWARQTLRALDSLEAAGSPPPPPDAGPFEVRSVAGRYAALYRQALGTSAAFKPPLDLRRP